MDVDSLLNPIKYPSPVQLQRKPKETGKKSTRQTKEKRRDLKKVIHHEVAVYDVVRQLRNAPSGLNFGQLMRGYTKQADSTR